MSSSINSKARSRDIKRSWTAPRRNHCCRNVHWHLAGTGPWLTSFRTTTAIGRNGTLVIQVAAWYRNDMLEASVLVHSWNQPLRHCTSQSEAVEAQRARLCPVLKSTRNELSHLNIWLMTDWQGLEHHIGDTLRSLLPHSTFLSHLFLFCLDCTRVGAHAIWQWLQRQRLRRVVWTLSGLVCHSEKYETCSLPGGRGQVC